jgi:AraC family transcriptional regulator of adaptative response/methylated-DNA-[protein]-cysteine methyltransferase
MSRPRSTGAAGAFPSTGARLRAVRARDPRADGRFVFAVITTGVYCRPSCSARAPRPENVRFFATPAAAEAAGFRACKRCQPRGSSLDERHRALVGAARAHIEGADARVPLSLLAARAGMSAFHFHRVFTRHTGMSPAAYAAAHRLRAFTRLAPARPSVTAAVYDAGYASAGRFYDGPSGALGLAPVALRRGGDGLRIHTAVRRAKLGHVLVAMTDRGVCAILLGDDPAAVQRELRARFPRAALLPAGRAQGAIVAAVVALVDGAPAAPDSFPLDLLGTAFQQRVWRALRALPAGATITYAALARALGLPRAARAVGAACAANTLAVAVPCHRVLREDGALGGYRWGLARKQALLARERSAGAPPARAARTGRASSDERRAPSPSPSSRPQGRRT